MASLLRQIVAGPRARHPEAGLDLCYVTDNIIATSGPSSTYPKRAYRNPTDQLVKFLDYKHGEDWSIFEFRAEGTGYPDSEVYNRIQHFPWPDHHPPPFALIPGLMAAMRNWLRDEEAKGKGKKRVAVVHCKAGKGRSGSVATSYLISEEGWKMEDALKRFTDRRMRVGFGEGVSIPSQLRWIRYVNRWTNQLKKAYVERRVQIMEIHVWGLRDGVKVAVEGYVDEGRRIENFHIFNRDERILVDDGKGKSEDNLRRSQSDALMEASSKGTESPSTNTSTPSNSSSNTGTPVVSTPQSSTPAIIPQSVSHATTQPATAPAPAISAAILRPAEPLILPTSDINIDFERRNKASYTGFTMVTSIAHVWFNAWFEGGSDGSNSGVFEIDWEAMDGIKGSARKGTKALERVKVVWKYVDADVGTVVREPALGQPVSDHQAADWRNAEKDGQSDNGDSPKTSEAVSGMKKGHAGSAGLAVAAGAAEAKELMQKELGLRKQKEESLNVSRASSINHGVEKASSTGDDDKTVKKEELESGAHEKEEEDLKGVKAYNGDEDVEEEEGSGRKPADTMNNVSSGKDGQATNSNNNHPASGGEEAGQSYDGGTSILSSGVGLGRLAGIVSGLRGGGNSNDNSNREEETQKEMETSTQGESKL